MNSMRVEHLWKNIMRGGILIGTNPHFTIDDKVLMKAYYQGLYTMGACSRDKRFPGPPCSVG